MKSDVIDETIASKIAIREPEYIFAMPRCDVTETNDNYVLHIEMPGVRKDGLTVTTRRDNLLIEGRVRWEQDGVLVRSEIPRRHFRRIFKLTQHADPQKIEASWHDGILKIQIAKMESAKPREIKINLN